SMYKTTAANGPSCSGWVMKVSICPSAVGTLTILSFMARPLLGFVLLLVETNDDAFRWFIGHDLRGVPGPACVHVHHSLTWAQYQRVSRASDEFQRAFQADH